jgi:EmrB/QacA subfamily drug resistance transporter
LSKTQGHPRRWLILAVVTVVAFIGNVDGTIVVVGLPRIVQGLHTTITTGLWTLTGYIITSTVFLLPAGRWSDLVGRKRIFLVGVGLFGLGTVLCGFAPSGEALVGWRLLQGVGAALSSATAVPLIAGAFPAAQTGRALGINSTAWVMGSIVGPVAGGALVGSLGWRWIFFVTVPFALAGLAAGAYWLPSDHTSRSGVSTDWVGAGTFTVALVALLVALSEGLAWGWASARIVTLFVLAAAALVGFTGWELRSRLPTFDLRLLRRPQLRGALAVVVFYSTGMFATTFLLTFYLQGALRLSPLDAGLALLPIAIPQLGLAPLGGALADRFGSARPVMLGLALLISGALLLSRLGPHLDLVAVVVPLLLISAGNGFAWPALTKAVVSSVPRERTGVASGMFFTLRNVGMALSFTLALVVAEASLPPQLAVRVFLGAGAALNGHLGLALVRSTDAGFRVFAGFCLVALVLAATCLHSRRAPQKAAGPVAQGGAATTP